MSLADSQRFGILRAIVSDWQRALKLLEDSGAVVKVTEVLAVEVAELAWVSVERAGDYDVLPADRPLLDRLRDESPKNRGTG